MFSERRVRATLRPSTRSSADVVQSHSKISGKAYEGVSKSSRAESITKCKLIFGITR
jgi:hypothetical protein